MITMATDVDNDNIMMITLYLRMYPQLLHHSPSPALLDPDYDDRGKFVTEDLYRLEGP